MKQGKCYGMLWKEIATVGHFKAFKSKEVQKKFICSLSNESVFSLSKVCNSH